MATNFLTQLPGFSKLPFGWGKGEEPHSPSTPPSGGYRARKSISEAHRPRLETEMSMSLINKGLLNPTGENNCFLNSAVQILWHIDVFRRSFRKVKGHMCVEKACIFCALKELFNEFQHGKQSVIPPDTLRHAMADCYEEDHRFQLGLMDDAAECFEKILEQLHLHLTGSEDMDTCSAAHCLSHQKFSLTILERTECVCGATSEPLSFVQFVHYISSSAIAKEAQKYADKEDKTHTPSSATEPEGQGSESNPETKDTSSGAVAVDNTSGSAATRPRLYSASQVHFGRILNQASAFGEYRQCPDYERCRKTVAVKRILLNCPDVVCLGMIWDSDRPSVKEIMSVVLSIGLTLQLDDLFDHVFADGAQFNQYELTALIAYYGRHYSTFCYHSKMREWVYFDDARFRTVGTEWEDVCEEIRKAHYQPLLLVYTNPFGETMDMSEAPKVVTKMKPPPQSSPAPQPDAAQPLSSIAEETASKDVTAVDRRQEKGAEKGQDLPPKEPEPVPTRNIEVPPSSTSAGSNLVLADPPLQPSSGLPGLSAHAQRVAMNHRLQTHSVDPMTLSLVPFPHGTVTGTKSTSPVLGNNSASATPTPEGATPTSARQLAGLSDEQLAPDLMSFSISPAVIGGGARGEKGPTSEPHSSGHQLESSSGGNADLIEFSLAPAVLNAMRSAPNAIRQPMTSSPSATPKSHSNTPVLQGTHPPVQSGSRSHSTVPPVANSHAPVTQGTRSPVLPLAHSHSPLHPGSHSDTSRGTSAFLPQSQSPRVKGGKAAGASLFHPNWEHFSVESLKPVSVAPQKRIQATPVASSGNYGNPESSGRKPSDDQGIEKAWTMVSKLSDSNESGDSGSKAVRQLQRVTSQPGFSEGCVVGTSDPSIGEFMLESVTLNEEVGKVRKFPPLPPTPDERKHHLAGDDKAKKPAANTTLLDDVEYAFPPADQMFVNSKSAKVNSGDRNFDYAELDFDPSTSKVGFVRGSNKNTKLDYVLLNTEEPRYELQTPGSANLEAEDDDYSRLVDVTVNIQRDAGRPIGNNPLYSVPDKTQQKKEKLANSGSTPIGRDPDYAPDYAVLAKLHAHSSGVGGQSRSGGGGARSSDGGVAEPGRTMVRERTHEAVAGLDLATRKKLHDAQDLFAKAEASAGNDDTVAMVLYQQFSTLLFQVLQDPIVSATPTLSQQIKARRADGVQRCLALQTSRGHSSKETIDLQGQCKGCGKQRNLGDQQLCGPCQLRDKLKRR